MHKQSTTEVMATQLELLESKIFGIHSIQDVIKDQQRIYTDFMCSDSAEDTATRNNVTVSHQTTMKLLGCIQMHVDPDGEVSINFTIE